MSSREISGSIPGRFLVFLRVWVLSCLRDGEAGGALAIFLARSQDLFLVVKCWRSFELSFLTIVSPGRRFSLHVAILFLTACNHDFSSGDSTLCSQYSPFLCVRCILASGRLRNSSPTLMLLTLGICGPRHGISQTCRGHEIVDGLIFPRCCVLVALNSCSRLILVILTSWPV